MTTLFSTSIGTRRHALCSYVCAIPGTTVRTGRGLSGGAMKSMNSIPPSIPCPFLPQTLQRREYTSYATGIRKTDRFTLRYLRESISTNSLCRHWPLSAGTDSATIPFTGMTTRSLPIYTLFCTVISTKPGSLTTTDYLFTAKEAGTGPTPGTTRTRLHCCRTGICWRSKPKQNSPENLDLTQMPQQTRRLWKD